MLMNPESVDPENIRLAAEAARVMRLDLAGVDVLSRDMGRPWYDNGAVICEVNAQPQLGDGTTPGIYQEILQELLGKQCRIPVHMLIVAAPAEQSAQSMESRAKTLGCNGHVLGCEVWVEGSRACGRHRNRFQAAVALLEHTSCRGALCLMSPADIVEFGLPTDRFEQVLLERAVERQPGFEHLLAMIRPHAGDVRFMDEPQ